jgi:Fe-S cluster assembly ATPase SufC
VDKVFVMKAGNIVREWGKELAQEISESGFGEV